MLRWDRGKRVRQFGAKLREHGEALEGLGLQRVYLVSDVSVIRGL